MRCRFHTRCPYARVVCEREPPGDYEVDGKDDHRAACFRRVENHEYWDSPPLTEDEERPEQTADD